MLSFGTAGPGVRPPCDENARFRLADLVDVAKRRVGTWPTEQRTALTSTSQSVKHGRNSNVSTCMCTDKLIDVKLRIIYYLTYFRNLKFKSVCFANRSLMSENEVLRRTGNCALDSTDARVSILTLNLISMKNNKVMLNPIRSASGNGHIPNRVAADNCAWNITYDDIQHWWRIMVTSNDAMTWTPIPSKWYSTAAGRR